VILAAKDRKERKEEAWQMAKTLQRERHAKRVRFTHC
jgi:hypothetical protein